VGSTNGVLLPIPELTESADGPKAISDLSNAIEDYFFDRIIPSGLSQARIASYNWGSVATLPTTGAKFGDTCYHTGLGSWMICHADGGGTWRQLRPGLAATEAAIGAIASTPALAALMHQGFTYVCADTKARAEWDGTRFLFFDTAWQSYTPTFESGVPMVSLGNGILVGKYYRTGREISVDYFFQVGSTTNIGAGIIKIGCPPGFRPAAMVDIYTGFGTYCGQGRASGASGVIVCTVVVEASAQPRRLLMVNAGDVVIQAGTGPTSIAAANSFVQGRATYISSLDA
jgi:hypothetical protein